MGCTKRSIVVGGVFFFFFPSFSGNGKIKALLGTTQQVMFQGQQIPVLLPSGTEEFRTRLAAQQERERVASIPKAGHEAFFPPPLPFLQ